MAECRNSGKSITVWCKEQGVACSSYHNWVKRLETAQPQQWAEVKSAASGEVRAEDIKLSCGRWTIAVGEGFNAKLLAEILRVVDAACC